MGVIGELGTGKSLYLVGFALKSLEKGILVIANFPVGKFENFDYKEPYISKYGTSVIPVNILFLFEWLKKEKQKNQRFRFPEHSVLLIIDEAYLDFESRTRTREGLAAVKLILQSRKFGLDVLHSEQITSSIDKRLFYMTDIWLTAKKVGMEGYEYFVYDWVNIRNKKEGTIKVSHEEFLEVRELYDTQYLASAAADEAPDMISTKFITEMKRQAKLLHVIG